MLDSKQLSDIKKERFGQMCRKIEESEVADSLNFLSELLYLHHGKKAIILLDEYDTPLQEAYLNTTNFSVLCRLRT